MGEHDLQIRHVGRRARATRLALAATAVVALVAAGCNSGSGGSAGGGDQAGKPTTSAAADTSQGKKALFGPADATDVQRGGTFIFGLEAEPDGLDPSRSRFSVVGQMIASAVFDPIATVDDKGKAVPYLAEKIEPNGDFTEWTITLRQGVKFHDGSPLDAEALKINFDYWTQSFITSLALTSLKSYEVTGQYTLKVTMTQPWATYPYLLSTQVGYVAAPSFLQNPDPSGPSMQPIGTGPFKYKEYLKGKSFTAERNRDYWQEGLPYLDQIRFDFLPDSTARMQALLDEDIDALHAYQPAVVLKVREEAAAGRLKVVENSDGEEDIITINTEKAPFDDITARKALAYATNADEWRKGPDKGVPYPATSPFAPGQLGFTAEDGYPGYDLEKAKALVAEYKAKTGKDIEAKYLATGNVDDMSEVQLLVDQWGKAGIKVTIQSVDQSTLIAQVVLGEYQLADWRNFGSPDPDGDYLWWHSKSVTPPPKISPNVARYKDPDIDKALDEARGSTDQAARDQAYQTVARELNEGVAYIWLARPVWVVAARPQVNGLAAAVNGTGVTLGAKTWLAKVWLQR